MPLLLLVQACDDDGGLNPSLSDDPALVGTWHYESPVTNTAGVRVCRAVVWVMRFSAGQTLADSTFTIAPDDPAAINEDPDDRCTPVLVSATTRSWKVPVWGQLVIAPGFGSLEPDTLAYSISGSVLTFGFATLVRAD